MIKEERLQLILGQVSKDGKVLLGNLSQHLNVSEDTVRRDIKELSDRGLLKSVRGGAMAHSPVPHNFRDREKQDISQKKIIASKALSFLKDGQVVIFDGGTSALAIAENLPDDLKITVVTNSFPIASVLEDHPATDVIFAGGRLSKSSFTTTGYETVQAFKNVRADICFLGVCSIDAETGLTTMDYEDAQLKKTMVATSKHIIALSTITKTNTAEAFYVCPITDLDTVITDVSPESEELKVYVEAGIQVL
ncbi:DeoR/GlpR family DNA-binding transcription regulator [Mucilaginibacter gynuensis]|uniref:DeoR/GlpR family DNA-binding transcription regulator n=1 Tax=Mucilaginibacter gynuensis TaxID=1302236 RepID=A0ABP8G248_9SPHI